MKNAINLLKKSIKYRYVSFICQISDPYGSRHNRYGVLDLGSERISCLIAKEDLWVPVDLSQTVRVGSMIRTIRDPDPWDQIAGSIFGIHGHVCLEGPDLAWRRGPL